MSARADPPAGPRTVLVTGAGRGIGRATVAELAGRGWRVVAGMRDLEAAERAGIARDGVHLVTLDVTDAAQVRAAVVAAESLAGGALDAVVLNAGYAVLGPIEDVELDEVRAVLETNAIGALAVLQAALPAMREAGRGNVVFVSTVGGGLPTPLLGAYRASKAALNAFAEVLSMETRPFGIRVARVEPGVVASEFSKATRMSGAIARGEGPYAPLLDEFRAAMRRWRAGYETPGEDVAAALADLVEDPEPPAVVLIGDDAARLAGGDEDHVLGFLGVDWPRR
jgi:NAD(P)-dependent dehydrogenase (short-subunit alcohol dehydrogenase family)